MDSPVFETLTSLLGTFGFLRDDIAFMFMGEPVSFNGYSKRDHGYWYRLSCAINTALEFHPNYETGSGAETTRTSHVMIDFCKIVTFKIVVKHEIPPTLLEMMKLITLSLHV